ncbi:hypothetical protein M9H77_33078 [Catharanthus roseus]|uniref:Uncharacterized protein n=1 Tax=Catharanthus roseus TaxID=4058 RepID=A0ACB9ZHZ1_CATRO|nr:hypothetical protein M9H77_33078 [Catharanthus roseus]
MATTSTTTPLSLSSSSALIDGGKAHRQSATAASSQIQRVTIPTLAPPPLQSHNRVPAKTTTAFCKKIARNVVAMATGEAPAEVAATELPEVVKGLQEAWDKVEDKYAVTSLAVAGAVALWGSTGLVSAIDRLPLVPGLFELVGIGYTGLGSFNRWCMCMIIFTLGCCSGLHTKTSFSNQTGKLYYKRSKTRTRK